MVARIRATTRGAPTIEKKPYFLIMTIRIISGTLKGTKLLSPGSNTTRPTSDRLREAIFNILRLHLQNADILDLFAGTGAMGIEALSRGGKYAIFMEKDKGAAMVIDKNIRRCRLGEKSAIIKRNVLSGLGFIKSLKNSLILSSWILHTTWNL